MKKTDGLVDQQLHVADSTNESKETRDAGNNQEQAVNATGQKASEKHRASSGSTKKASSTSTVALDAVTTPVAQQSQIAQAASIPDSTAQQSVNAPVRLQEQKNNDAPSGQEQLVTDQAQPIHSANNTSSTSQPEQRRRTQGGDRKRFVRSSSNSGHHPSNQTGSRDRKHQHATGQHTNEDGSGRDNKRSYGYQNKERSLHQNRYSNQSMSNNQPRNSDQSGQYITGRDQGGSNNNEQKKPLSEMSLVELQQYARSLGVVGAALMPKMVLFEKIKFMEANPDLDIDVVGILEKLPDGFGFLRSIQYEYLSSPDDIYVSPSQIRRFNLRTGDLVHGVIRKPKDGEKYFALLKLTLVNDQDPLTLGDRPHFDRLTPMHPNKKLTLEFNPSAISTRVMDLFTPIGKGQRALLVAPPRVGKTMLLKELTQSLMANYPEIHLMILLIDERPEEVADMRRTVKGSAAEVISSTFDESAERHVQVAEIVLERAKRLVELGKDVVILLDSITRLARAYNAIAPSSGKILTGGVDANALQHPKRFFGAARNIEEGGSLTIIGSALVETGSRMEEVIFEEFKGTGNSEIHMTRQLSYKRIYPSFDLVISGTRRDDLLQNQEELNKVLVLQKFLSTMNKVEGMEFIIEKMKRFKTNAEFLESINKK